MNLRKVHFHFQLFLIRSMEVHVRNKKSLINICISVTHKLHFQPRLLFWVPESSILPFKYLSSTTIQRIWAQIYYPLHLFPQIITDHLSIFLISEMTTDLKLILDTFLSYTSVPNPSPSLIDCTTLIPFKRIHISFSIVIVLVQVTYLKNWNNVLLSSPDSWDSPKIENADLIVSHPPHCSLCPGALGAVQPLQGAALFTTGSW